MKWQPTAILAIIAVGIAAYIYFVERKKPDQPLDARTVYAWNLSDLQAEPLSRVEIKMGTASAVFVKLQPKPTPTPSAGATASPDPLATPPQPTWHKADKPELGLTYQWDSSWSDFKRMMMDRVVEEKPTDDKAYELSSPSLEIKMGTDKKPDMYSLAAGKKSMTGSGYYARAGKDPKVYLLASYKFDSFSKLVSEPPVATPTPPPTPEPTPEPTPTPEPIPSPAANPLPTIHVSTPAVQVPTPKP